MVFVWILLIALVAYPLTMRAIAYAVQPRRLEMAQLGRRLLASPNLSEPDRKSIRLMLADAFNAKMPIILAVMFPVFVVLSMINHSLVRDLETGHRRNPMEERFYKLHVISLAAANPIFFIVLVAEVLLFGGFLAAFRLFHGHVARFDILNIQQMSVAKSEAVLKRAHLTNAA